ncbi:MAG: hypothetical protein ACYTDT_04365 [Planctomycetota bacterium]|jgi:hypothetical protein
MKALPSNQKLWSQFKDRGLSFFLVEVQENTFEQIEELAKKYKVDIPMPLRFESDFTGFVPEENGTKLPYAYVISPEGKVVWQGKDGYEAQVRKQLDRLTYKTLRRIAVDPAVAAAAQQYEDGQFAKAHKSASKAADKAEEGSEAATDAAFVLAKIDSQLDSMQQKVDSAIEAKRYHDALKTLEVLAGKAYKGLEESGAAAKQLKELKKDKQVKAELKAWAAFDKVLAANKNAKSDADRVENLATFARRNEDTAAAAEATKLIQEIAGKSEE